MSAAKVKSFLPVPSISSSDDESKSPVPMKDRVAVYANKIAQSSGTGSNISPVPTPKSARPMYGQLLTPVPGRLTPTGHGRIKAPPVCTALSLKRVASTMEELNTSEVCFSLGEAESCAEKAHALGGTAMADIDAAPLNIEKCDPGFSWKRASESGEAHVSSSSTVITTSSAGSLRSSMGSETASMASMAVKQGPPLEVVRMDPAVNLEDELAGGGERSADVPQPAHDVSKIATSSLRTPKLSLSGPSEASSSTASLSATFTNNLVSGNESRQGRSRQRWLVHSPTEELVRQVAGCVPITRDGRIILVSASRKMEWILPKGGWDTDETKEECAARETFEEAGLLGDLGGCLGSIDYETSKAKKRRLGKKKIGGHGKEKELGKGIDSGVEGRKRGGSCQDMPPPFPKRVKTEATVEKAEPCDPTCSVSEPASSVALKTPLPPAASSTTVIDPSKYSFVRLFLFPIYVSSVKSDWPEKGRLRKLVTIDEAIQIMEKQDRQYFKRGLEMVKERGLHLLMGNATS